MSKVTAPKGYTLRFTKTVPNVPHIASRLKGFPERCKMGPGEEYEVLLLPQEIRVVDILYRSEQTVVFLGKCQNNKEVALKFTTTHDILVESGAHDALAAIQGPVLPKMYGVLHGQDGEGRKMLCLVLERFGKQLETRFRDLEKNEKAKILNKLAEAHRTGLHHLDFVERNVLVKRDDYRICDLGHVQPHNPRCKWTYDFVEHVEDDDVEEGQRSIRCKGMRAWAEEMRFWDHGKLLLCQVVWVPKSDKLPS
ncbi:hypothetical protein EUX98_g6064 [Antrodiella citrinella]|uniref:Protein kinase domain-containing protein n=1 Tax=Antrodiella citrinella TaxID=2447956 RepID=A0A4S4MQW9_9APHY|nr:hypothetical protein EUX98_g6064 [Antrodiella citrinella]